MNEERNRERKREEIREPAGMSNTESRGDLFFIFLPRFFHATWAFERCTVTCSGCFFTLNGRVKYRLHTSRLDENKLKKVKILLFRLGGRNTCHV